MERREPRPLGSISRLRHHRVALQFGPLRDVPGQVARGGGHAHVICGSLRRVVLPPQRAACNRFALFQECPGFVRDGHLDPFHHHVVQRPHADRSAIPVDPAAQVDLKDFGAVEPVRYGDVIWAF